MNIPHSDAPVIFGASGDLVCKKIFPALYAMERRGHLQVPVIGVASSDWTIEKFRARARSTEKTVSDAAAALQAAVQVNHFGVMQVHNLQETMAKKSVEFAHECQIFEVC